jgi:hypothetical protein
MILVGKISGVILGLPFGVFGVLLGALAGTLVDQLLQMRQGRRDLEKFFLEGQFVPRLKRLIRPAAAIGLVNSLLAIDDITDDSLREEVVRRIADFFRVPLIDHRRMYHYWDLCERWDRRVDREWLVRVYGVSSPDYLELSEVYSYGGEAERDFLFTLFHSLAGRDPAGLSRGEYAFFLEVFEPMGLSRREIQQRLRSIPYLNRSHCRILGVEPDCSEAQVKKRYRELAARLHPDSYVNIGYSDEGPDEQEQERRQEEFTRLQHAYEELLWQFRYYD